MDNIFIQNKSEESKNSQGNKNEFPVETPVQRSTKLVAWLSVGIVFFICFLDFTGWIFNISLLKSVSQNWVPMKVITALCLVSSAIALVLAPKNLAADHNKFPSKILGAMVILIGLMTIAIYLSSSVTGLDSFIANAPILKLFLAPAT